jgi:hypothetical protein
MNVSIGDWNENNRDHSMLIMVMMLILMSVLISNDSYD